MMVPNNVVLSAAVVPLREPAARRPARAPAPRRRARATIQAMLDDAITTPVAGEPTIALEEIDADEVVVRIQATPLPTPTARSSPTRCSRPSARERTPSGRLSACRPGPLDGVGGRHGAELALDRADRPGGERREQRARAQRQRRDVELRAVVLDRLHDGARRRPPGVLVPT